MEGIKWNINYRKHAYLTNWRQVLNATSLDELMSKVANKYTRWKDIKPVPTPDKTYWYISIAGRLNVDCRVRRYRNSHFKFEINLGGKAL